jgi:hypothetical protein
LMRNWMNGWRRAPEMPDCPDFGKSHPRYPTRAAASRQTCNFSSRPTPPQLSRTAPVSTQNEQPKWPETLFGGFLPTYPNNALSS